MLTEDLFRGDDAPVLTVSQVNQRVKKLIEGQLAPVAVQGEISNFKVVSGHAYFVLKDSEGQLAAVLFRIKTLRLAVEPKDGLTVVARGRLTLYVPYGRYQLMVDSLAPVGAGAWQAAFNQLKEKLALEGLFAPERKRPLPLLPRAVAVVTSATGAVIRDIVHVAVRRFPQANILLVPARVQGPDAPDSIVAAIGRANQMAEKYGLDALILARGGGSIEDLWAFNNEQVARTIVASGLPVVSAVGHETDFTIADFVADVRAPTPSAAAELVFPVASELALRLRVPMQRAGQAVRREVQMERHRLRAARLALGDGKSLVGERIQRLSGLQSRLEQAIGHDLAAARLRVTSQAVRLQALHPRERIRRWRQSLTQCHGRLTALLRQNTSLSRSRLLGLSERVTALSPMGVLERGYSITLDAQGKLVRDASAVRRGDSLAIVLARGRLGANVDKIEPGNS